MWLEEVRGKVWREKRQMGKWQDYIIIAKIFYEIQHEDTGSNEHIPSEYDLLFEE